MSATKAAWLAVPLVLTAVVAWTWRSHPAAPHAAASPAAPVDAIAAHDPAASTPTRAIDGSGARTAHGETVDAPALPALQADCIVGRVRDSEGRGLAGVRVEAARVRARSGALRLQADEREDADEAAWATSDSAGDYAIGVLEHRPYVVTAHASGFAPAASAVVFAGGRADFVLGPGAHLSVASEPLASLVARVQDPVQDVELWRANGTTDAAGATRFEGVPAGELTVEARAGSRRGVRRANSDGVAAIEVAIPLEATGRIIGHVRDAVSGAGLVGAELALDGRSAVASGPDGAFAIEDVVLGDGARSLSARALEHATDYRYVRLTPDAPELELELALAPGVRAFGTLVESDGRPLAGARLEWEASHATRPFLGERERGATRTGANGDFALVGLTPDTPHRLVAHASGRAPGVFACAPIPPGAPPLDLGTLVLEPGGGLAGLAPAAAGAAEPWTVELEWAAAEAEASLSPALVRLESTLTDPSGAFAFDALAAGRYRLRLVAPDSAPGRAGEQVPAELVVVLAPGESRRDLVLAEGNAFVSGRVVAPDERGFGGCVVRLLPEGAEDAASRLDEMRLGADGVFRLAAGAAAGPMRVEVADSRLFYATHRIDGVWPGAGELRIVLEPFRSAHSIRGILVAVSGALPGDVFVAFTDTTTGERLSRVAIPEADGRFAMENLLDVPYDLELVDFGDRFRPFPLRSVRPGTEVELRLEPR